MKIAQVAPLYESVPPKFYGGTERVVSYLTEELVRQGHEVTLFASGDSATRARLEPITSQALRLDPDCVDPIAHHIVMLDRVLRKAHLFDIIHFHTEYLHFPLMRTLTTSHITTRHGRLDLADFVQLHREFADIPLISISQHQRAALPSANWLGTVYHGLPESLYTYRSGGDYLAFLGRVSPEKGLTRAIDIAKRSGMTLRIAAKIDKGDREYFETTIKPLLGPGIEFLGEVGERDKGEFLGNARALLFPIDWPEPFGIVMIEAMACGTPIIAWNRGSVPEIVQHGVNGFIVNDVEAAVSAVARVSEIDRARCRQVFEERFSARRMTRDYLAAYEQARKAAVRRSVA